MSTPSSLSRRSFLGTACLAGLVPGLASAAAASPAPGAPAREKSAMKVGLDAGPGRPELLTFMRQIDVKWVCASLPATQGTSVDPALLRGVVTRGLDAGGGIGGPPGGPSGPWKPQEVEGLVRAIESAGLRLGALYLHGFTNVILGNAERDRDIEHVCKSIALAGRFGIPVLLYNFFGLRNVEGLYSVPGRGGAVYRAFDDSRVKTQAPVPGLGRISDEQMWEHLHYFLKAVVPAAEEAGVRLAQHPNDPPPPSYRGIAQPFDTVEHWKRLVNAVPSPANGIVLETGVTAELGGDVEATIRYFAARDCINHVHFRNVRTLRPALSYVETFIDEGQTDMYRALRTLHETGYSHMIVPDHSPDITGDTHRFGAWGYALGYIKGMLRSLET